MEYPTRNGLPISPLELGYGGEASLIRQNHHNAWTARTMGRLLLTLTFRNLETTQFQIPPQPHTKLHEDYDPPQLELPAVYEYVNEEYERGNRLRYGSADRPKFKGISKETMKRIDEEYRRLR